MPRHVFSLPSLADADALVAFDGLPLMAADAALHGAADGVHSTQVAEANVRRKRLPRTETARAC